jgi:hypothetical protein
MKSNIITFLLRNIVDGMLEYFPPERISGIILDFIEELQAAVEESENPYDDVLLPMLNYFRGMFGIDPE